MDEERKLTEKDKEIIANFKKHLEVREENSKNDTRKWQTIWDMPRLYKLTEEEKAAIPAKLAEYISIRDHAIDVHKKWIKHFKAKQLDEDPKENEALLKDLAFGLDLLKRGRARVFKAGVEGLIAELERYKDGNKPGLGLSRGFGEMFFYHADYSDEITDAVDAIEDYWRTI